MNDYTIPRPPTSEAEAEAGVKALYDQGLQFNPDTRGAEICDAKWEGQRLVVTWRILTDGQAVAWDRFAEAMFEVCDDPYGVSMRGAAAAGCA